MPLEIRADEQVGHPAAHLLGAAGRAHRVGHESQGLTLSHENHLDAENNPE